MKNWTIPLLAVGAGVAIYYVWSQNQSNNNSGGDNTFLDSTATFFDELWSDLSNLASS